MSDTYLGAFALKAAPFSKEIADGGLWLPSSKAGVVDELCEAVSEHASVAPPRLPTRQGSRRCSAGCPASHPCALSSGGSSAPSSRGRSHSCDRFGATAGHLD